MSEPDPAGGLFDAAPPTSRRGRRRGRRRSGCLPILVVVTVIAVGAWFVLRNLDLGNPFSSEPDDFGGNGRGNAQVGFEVAAGDSISVMGRNLADLGVVASVEAFVDAAEANDGSGRIQQGSYVMYEEMSGSSAVALLVSGDTRGVQYTFTPGKTVEEIVDLLARDTEIPRDSFEKALADPEAIGLPEEAEGDAEGYLAPGSYLVLDDSTAGSILSDMVERYREEAKRLDLAAAADRLGYSLHDLVTVASLVQAEGSLLDERGKSQIARVIYNRLADTTGGTLGRLQLDATVNYARGEKVAVPTQAQIDEVADSPYNTYTRAGLPPGAIATPSEEALRAAAEPAEGAWLYYVTVNLATGRTVFTESYDEFLAGKQQLQDYCATRSDRC